MRPPVRSCRDAGSPLYGTNRTSMGGRVAQFAGRLLGGRDQFAKVLVGRVARHDQDVRNRKHGAYGREVGVGVIGQLVEQRRIDRQRVDVAVAEGRAVRARALDAGHADRAGRARLVLDDDIGVERLAQMRHRDAREDVGGAARRRRDDHRNGLVGPRLGGLLRRRRAGQRQRRRQRKGSGECHGRFPMDEAKRVCVYWRGPAFKRPGGCRPARVRRRACLLF